MKSHFIHAIETLKSSRTEQLILFLPSRSTSRFLNWMERKIKLKLDQSAFFNVLCSLRKLPHACTHAHINTHSSSFASPVLAMEGWCMGVVLLYLACLRWFALSLPFFNQLWVHPVSVTLLHSIFPPLSFLFFRFFSVLHFLPSVVSQSAFPAHLLRGRLSAQSSGFH